MIPQNCRCNFDFIIAGSKVYCTFSGGNRYAPDPESLLGHHLFYPLIAGKKGMEFGKSESIAVNAGWIKSMISFIIELYQNDIDLDLKVVVEMQNCL
jgi:hypothetical protein